MRQRSEKTISGFGLILGLGMILTLATPIPAAFLGDLNEDGFVTLPDLLLLTKHWGESGSQAAESDVDGDGDADLFDYTALAQYWLQSKFITATASSSEGPAFEAYRAIDGDFSTRWSSEFADNQWLLLDLGHTRTVSGLELYWEAAYASEYEVKLSLDGSDWLSVYDTNTGDGDYDNINFPARSARYVKISCVTRATVWGFSILELFVQADDTWSLVWEDDLDSYDPGRWQKATHTWDQNLARFVPDNVTFGAGKMKLNLTNVPTGSKSYSGAEYRTIDSYLYGKFVVRMKAAPGSGIISSFFTYRDPANEPTWNEIDIEFLGKDTSEIHFNHWWSWWPNQDPVVMDLGYAADQEFHEYSFEWQPNYIRWSVDGTAFYVATHDIPWLAQKVMMNIWISSITEWAGPFHPDVLPTYAEYDYVRYYQKNY